MEKLLTDVADIGFAAERAGRQVEKFKDLDDRIGKIMAFIFNLSRDVEDQLENFQNDKTTELEIGFLMDEGIDPWSLFGDKPK